MSVQILPYFLVQMLENFAQRLCHNICINLKFCLRYVLVGINNKGSEAYAIWVSMKYSECLCISSPIPCC